ncbi:MAG: nucleotide exchange factor GrpE [Bacillota bacterium]|nr:nucleotide exchange factor GrpE [Bacillota bacterium]
MSEEIKNEKACNKEEAKTTEESSEDTKSEVNDIETNIEEVDETAKKIEALEAEKATLSDQMLRLAAEYDNFRKRTSKEKESLWNDAVSATISDVIPLIDDFERAISQECSDKSYKDGVDMVYKKFTDMLQKLNISEIPADGEFNPELHEAIIHIEDDSLPQNSISEVMRKGYMLGGKVIRHTLVKVAN